METSAIKARDKFVKCVGDRGNQQEKPGDSEGAVQRNRRDFKLGEKREEGRGRWKDRDREGQKEACTHTHRLRGKERERGRKREKEDKEGQKEKISKG